jgi:hypothetical protein
VSRLFFAAGAQPFRCFAKPPFGDRQGKPLQALLRFITTLAWPHIALISFSFYEDVRSLRPVLG